VDNLASPSLLHTISTGFIVTLLDLFLVIIGFVAYIVLHELVHGAFFWIYSRNRPKFGFRKGYAYAAAPGWFFPRGQYLVIALAPFVLLSILGMALVAMVPVGAIVAILFGMVANAAGAVGDMWIAVKVLREHRKILIEDWGDGMNFYALS
jgi:Putative zincin peptidase